MNRFSHSFLKISKTKLSFQSIPSSFARTLTQNGQFGSQPNSSLRFFSNSSSHPDFEPKKKEPTKNFNKQLQDLQETIKKDISENKVILYMKGTPAWPECGFSRAVIQILDQYGIKYASRNMNADIPMKEALKVYSSWPTIPQLYVNGELIGGCDIVTQMHKEGELESLFEGVELKEKKKRDLAA